MPIEGHFIGSGGFSDRVDPYRPDPVPIKQLYRGRQDAFSRRNSIVFSVSYRFCCGGHGVSS
jgi:hypothetical protein